MEPVNVCEIVQNKVEVAIRSVIDSRERAGADVDPGRSAQLVVCGGNLAGEAVGRGVGGELGLLDARVEAAVLDAVVP